MAQRLYVLMGVAGCGKTSIGAGVAAAIGAMFLDGDDFHPKANIDKMAKGMPLNDDDRWPWLARVGTALALIDGVGLIGCSALKRSYRDYIAEHAGETVQFIYLDGAQDMIAARMAEREGHFMPTSLLESQFAALEVPQEPENHIKIDITGSKEQVIAMIAAHIHTQN